ncbi:MAG: TlpA family protein disulfide reductase [Planctomycetota bacterium]|jgi:peroxiredoxin
MPRFVLAGTAIAFCLIGAPASLHAQDEINVIDQRGEAPRNENELEDPREIIQRSIEALLDVNSVRYRSHLESVGPQSQFMPRLEGSAVVQSDPGSPIQMRFFSEARVTTPDDPEGISFDIAFDGTRIFALDHPTSRLIWGSLLTGGTDLLMGTTELVRDVYVSPNPFSLELEAESIEMQGVARNVFERDLYVVVATFSPEFSLRWFIDTQDFLPRRMDRLQKTEQGDLTVKYIIQDLEINPEITDDTFVLSAPEGYTTHEYDTSGLLPTGEIAPDFTLKDQDGNDVSLSDYRGQVVIIDFWATWCSACKVTMPGVNNFARKYEDTGVKVIGIQTMDPGKESEGRAYFHEQGYTYTDLYDEGDLVAQQYRLTVLPSFYVIGKDGTVLSRFPGGPQEEMLEQILSDYLPELD